MTLRMRRPALRLLTSGALRDAVSTWLSHIALWLVRECCPWKTPKYSLNVNALVYSNKTTAAAAFDSACSETRLLTIHSAEALECALPHITDVVEHDPAGLDHRTWQSDQCSCAVVPKRAPPQMTKAPPGQTGQCAHSRTAFCKASSLSACSFCPLCYQLVAFEIKVLQAAEAAECACIRIPQPGSSGKLKWVRLSAASAATCPAADLSCRASA